MANAKDATPEKGFHVYKAICAVQNELAEVGIQKLKKNKQGEGFMYRGIDDVYNTLAPLLAKHQLCIIPRAVERTQVERVSNAGKALFYTTLKVDYEFVSAVDGSGHIASAYGEAMDSGDKSTNKAMSSAYKYCCFQVFCIPVDVADADAETHTVAPANGIPEEQLKALLKNIEEATTIESLRSYYRALSEAEQNATNKAVTDKLAVLKAKQAPEPDAPAEAS